MSLKVGIAIAAVGLTALATALVVGMRGHDDHELSAMQTQLDQQSTQLKTARDELSTFANDAKRQADECSRMRADNDLLQVTVDARQEKLAKAGALQTASTPTPAVVTPALAKPDNSNAQAHEQPVVPRELAMQMMQRQFAALKANFPNMIVAVEDQAQSLLGTGFYFEIGDNALAVTAAPAASLAGQLTLFSPMYQNGQPVVNGVAQVGYGGTLAASDEASGLSFVRLQATGNKIVLSKMSLNNLAEAAAGENVYVINTQSNADHRIQHIAVLGTVVKLEQNDNQPARLQLALAYDKSSCGAPLFNLQGQLTGIICGPADSGRGSYALTATELANAVVRARKSVEAAEANPAAPAPGPGAAHNAPNAPKRLTNEQIIAAANALKMPYKPLESLRLEFAPNFSQYVFAGPDNLCVIWDDTRQELCAYRPRNNVVVWEHRVDTSDFGNGHAHGIRVFNAPDRFWLYGMDGKQKNAESVEVIDLRTGKPLSRNPINGYLSSAAFVYECGGMLFTADPGFGTGGMTDPVNGGLFRFDFVVAGLSGNHAFVHSSGFNNIDLSVVSKLIRQHLAAEKRWLSKPGDQAENERYNKETAELNGQIDKLMRRPQPPGIHVGYRGPMHCWLLPGDRILFGTQLWEVTADAPKLLGELPVEKHTGAAEPWFPAYLQERDRTECMLGVSPDGKWAVSNTHLYDLKELKAAAELPLPTTAGGFLSDNKTLYLFDSYHQRIYFLTVAELTQPRK